MTRILAFDPSYKRVGWCVYDAGADKVLEYQTFMPQGETLDLRLENAFQQAGDIGVHVDRGIGVHGPRAVAAIESPVYYRSVKTAIRLSQLNGVLRLGVVRWTSRMIDVLPQERLAACGLPVRMRRANAKQAVLQHVNQRFGLGLEDHKHDVADAVAVALAAAIKLREEEWDSYAE